MRRETGTGVPAPESGRHFPGPRIPDPGDPPRVALAQIRAALERRNAHRREAVAEVASALAALADAVARHAGRVEDVRRAVEAQGGDLEPLQFYDSLMARLRMELRAAERTLADVFRVAADESAAAR
ncbi:MAG: hypothetical protein ABR998_04975 [Gemmatimonadales bacterium]